MDTQNKCCGNCLFFKNEDILGFGYCECHENERQVGYCCGNHVDAPESLSGWAEITPDNVGELYDKPVAVAWEYEGKSYYRLIGDCMVSPSKMAELGGYYYYVLPELKIE